VIFAKQCLRFYIKITEGGSVKSSVDGNGCQKSVDKNCVFKYHLLKKPSRKSYQGFCTPLLSFSKAHLNNGSALQNLSLPFFLRIYTQTALSKSTGFVFMNSGNRYNSLLTNPRAFRIPKSSYASNYLGRRFH